ncbi:MAG: helicase-exonuclease AddAB subunit AddA [Clostridiales bacterium]|jgi:ATP-dependent helicase/nuclease subunit A|nr:helicase-exonuclease AddAB subunit AddA [Clostridiales bacterium]
MPDFTENQLLAVNLRPPALLVSAAAGSGKTAVLIERIIRIITAPKDAGGSDITRLLIVTFTEAAAAEMRDRLNRAVGALLKESPEDENLRRQTLLLGKANIATIHSFCLKVVREGAPSLGALGVDTKFKVGEAAETAVLKQEALEEIFTEAYSEAGSPSLADLADMYGGSKYKDDGLRQLIIKAYDFISASPWSGGRARLYASAYDGCRRLETSPWARLFIDMLRAELETAVFALENAAEDCLRPGGPEKYLPAIEDDLERVNELKDALELGLSGVFAAFSAFSFSEKPLPRYGAKDERADPALRESVKNAKADARKDVNGLIKKYFTRSLADYEADISALGPILRAFAEIVERFANRFSEKKRERGVLDFSDLEQFALKILYDGDREISEAAKDWRGRFDEVLTDEYQDSNPVQERILAAVSGSRRFMVGDVKQSIYRFRNSDPAIFMEKYGGYSPYSGAKNQPHIRVTLDKNFRSRKSVISFINFIFSQIMTAELGGVSYDEENALSFGAAYPEEGDFPVEILLIDHTPDETESPEAPENEETPPGGGLTEADLTRVRLEARLIARRIKKLMDERRPVFEKGVSHAADYGDFAVLAPSVSAVAAEFEEEFAREGVPLFVSANEGYINSPEVSAVLNLLRVIDNPKQDVSFAAVLRSPVCGLSSDEMARIRLFSDKPRFFDAASEYLKGNSDLISSRLGVFFALLDEFWALAPRVTISEFIWTLYGKTRCLEYASALPDGAKRAANLKTLAEHALTYEKTRFRGIFHFIQYIEKLAASGSDLSGAKPAPGGRVRLTTIHASKGLEFPFVFLCASRAFNNSDNRQKILFDREYGFGADVIDLEKFDGLENRVRYGTLPRAALEHKAAAEEVSERLRVLYVAATRAREGLFFVGAVRRLRKNLDKWGQFSHYKEASLPAHCLLKAGNFLDFIMPAAMRQKSGGLKITEYSSADFPEAAPPRKDAEPAGPAAEPDSLPDCRAEYERVKRLFVMEYPHKKAEALPSKISVSEIKRIFHERTVGPDSEPYFAGAAENDDKKPLFAPRFLSGERRFSGAFIGTAIHACMERLDFNDITEASVKKLIASLAAKRLIEPALAEKIPVAAILRFGRSELAARIRKSPKVRRETPFVMALPAADIYGEEYAGVAEDVLIHGIIDLFFEENGELVIVDYKSDKAGNLEQTAAMYAPQLSIYKKAVERGAGLLVRECRLYMFSHNKDIEINAYLK